MSDAEKEKYIKKAEKVIHLKEMKAEQDRRNLEEYERDQRDAEEYENEEDEFWQLVKSFYTHMSVKYFVV